MNDRIQRALDDDIDLNTLTPAEMAELEESSSLFSGILRSIPATHLPPLGPAVLDRLDASREVGVTPVAASQSSRQSAGLIGWLWSPTRISIPFRPAYALGLAAMLTVLIGIRSTKQPETVAVAPASAAAASNEVLVHFQLDAPKARAVSLAGDFSNWAPKYSMERSTRGVWTIVVPLAPGVHNYSFVVDGETWVPDPSAPAMADGFGGMNSRIAVLAPDAQRSL